MKNMPFAMQSAGRRSRAARPESYTALLLWVAVSLLLATSAGASTRLRVMGFAGSSNWPIFVAQEQGFFARHAIEVEHAVARSSGTQMDALLSGNVDIALTAMDNVVAYAEGQAGRPRADLVAVFGVNQGGRSKLVVARDITSFEQLRGRAIAVDAVATGYAFVLMELLRRATMKPGDYKLVSAGGSRERWNALRDGAVAGALLNAPMDAVAESAGFRTLASSSEVLDHYQGSVGAVRREWARDHAAELVAFIRGYVEAVEWLREPTHRDAAGALLVRHVRGITPADAMRSYEELLDASSGALAPRAAVDVEGVRKVLELRSAYAPSGVTLADPLHYYDPSYHRRALEHD